MPLPVPLCPCRTWTGGSGAALAAFLVVFLARTTPAEAQFQKGVDSWARATTGITTAHWDGARVPYPAPLARPEGLLAVRSWFAPVAIHAPPGAALERVLAALDAVESAHALLSHTGWYPGGSDGGLGGGPGTDIYLVDDLEDGAMAATDPLEPFRYLDTATTFALSDSRVPGDRIAPCVTEAYVQALLLAQDPSEAASVRRALACYVTWLLTGAFGCDESALDLLERPASPFMDRDDRGLAGAAWLALLGHRQDLNRGDYVHGIGQITRQRTWEGDDLRASPDFWEATSTILRVHKETFEDVADELAVARYLQAPALFEGATQPRLSGSYELAKLPVRTRPTTPALGPLGSAYYLVQTPVRARPANEAALQIWLRGEYGVRWALSAVRLDANGRDRGRVSAPARDNPKSFLALSLEQDTAAVLIVVTNLSSRLPDADTGDNNTRAAHLVIDRGAAGAPVIPLSPSAR